MQRRATLSLMASAVALRLAGCGFAPRKAPNFAFSTLYSAIAETSPLGVELRRSLQATGKVKVISDAAQINQAQVVLEVLSEQREKVVLSLNTAGQVREFQLLALSFQAAHAGRQGVDSRRRHCATARHQL